MRTYERPVAIANDEWVEGVYMASGDGVKEGRDCYTATAKIHQTPETGREDYRIQFDARHAAKDNHHSGKQRMEISFNMPVEYVSSGGKLESGNHTQTLKIGYNYHNNASDNIGLGDLVVKADAGLAITNTVLVDVGMDCGQH